MPYLFETQIAEVKRKSNDPNACDKLDAKCQTVTASLLQQHPRLVMYLAGDAAAEALAKNMGSKARNDRLNKNGPHAMDAEYVGDDWRMVSDNCNDIYGKVSDHLDHAFALGLDIRSPVVVGKMYALAVKIWSLGAYTGFEQYEGKR